MENPIFRFLLVLLTILFFFPISYCGASVVLTPPPNNPRSMAGAGYIDVSWDAGPNGHGEVVGYKVYKRTTGTAYNETTFFSTTQPSYRDTQVAYGISYVYGIMAVFKDTDGRTYESGYYAETGEMYVDTKIKTYSDAIKSKAAPFSSPPAIAVAGDINKDGKADLILGFPQENKVRIYLDCNTNTLPSIVLSGEMTGDQFGSSIAIADLDKDGYNDLVIGAPYSAAGTSPNIIQEAGKVYIYRGARSFSSTPALILKGKAAYDGNGAPYSTGEHLGTSLAAIGDINGDSYQDVAIGAPQGGTARSGRVVVLQGGSTISDRTTEIIGPTPMKYFGQSVASAGDVNGDGSADILVGAANCDQTPIPDGEARVIHGGVAPTLSEIVLSGPNCYGSLVAGLNFNGDAYSDIAVGSKKSPYAADVYYGGQSNPTQPSISFPTKGGLLASLSDLNGDVFSDILVANTAVHYGGTSADNVTDILRADDGETVIGIGDVNGDGNPDILAYSSGYVYANSLASYATLPKITVDSPQDSSNIMYYRYPTVDGTITGSVSRLIVAGGDVTPTPAGHFSHQVGLHDGLNTFEIYAETPDGKVTKRRINLNFVPPPPLTIQITSPVDGATVNSTPIMVEGTVNDSSATVRVNGTLVAVNNGSFQTVLDLNLGDNQIDAWAIDQYDQYTENIIHVQLVYAEPTVTLNTSPASIHPGQSSTLSWTSTNADSCSISPGIGSVPVSGSVSVSPALTTTYTITATGVGGSVTATADVVIINQPPIAGMDSAETYQDTPIIINVLANDSDPDGDLLSISSVSQGAHGSVILNPDKSTIYTPSSGFKGSDTFTYSITDGHGGTASATVSLTILAINHPPVAVNDSAEVFQGGTVSINVLANDSDPDGDALHIVSFTQTANGAVIDAGNGVLRYTPAPGFTGTDTFSYIAQDPSGATSAASVSITVKSLITLHITSPLPGEVINDTITLIEGSIVNRAGLETGITVNGIPAIIYGSQFIANQIPLEDGENTITATAKDTSGNTASESIYVNADTSADCVRIRSTTYIGIAPFQPCLIIKGSSQGPSLTYTGPGVIELLPSTTKEEYPIKITTEGLYHITAEAPNSQGTTCSNTLAIAVSNKDALDGLLRGKWSGMRSKLNSGAIEEALAFFREGSRNRYREIFTRLADKMSTITSEMQDIEMITIEADRTQYRINRVHSIDGEPVTLTYFIYFILDEDGMWRIDEF